MSFIFFEKNRRAALPTSCHSQRNATCRAHDLFVFSTFALPI